MRGTSYIFPNTPLTAADGRRLRGRRLRDRPARQHQLRGLDGRPRSQSFYATQLADFAAKFTEPRRARHQPHALHRLERLGDARPKVEKANGIRLDTNYYYWPGELGATTGPAS